MSNHLLQTSTFTKHQNFLRPLSSVGVSCKWQPTVGDCDHVKQWLVINLLCCYLLFDSHVHCMNYDTGSIGKFCWWKHGTVHVTWHFVFLFTWTAHRNTNRFYSTFCGHVHFNNQQRSQHYFTWHFVFIFTWTAHRKTNIISLTFCGHVHFNNQQRSQHYFTWHFVFIFTWTAHRKTNIISLTFCGRVHLNSQQRNWHILLDILWSCYLNHLQINQHISPDILFLYSLELPTEKTTYFT